MYLSRVGADNFRIFGSKEEGNNLDVRLKPGLTLIVGENDSGKTALLDAIRYVLGTQSYEPTRLTADDFHLKPDGSRAERMNIVCEFEGLDQEEAGAFLEWLEFGDPTGGDASQPTYRLRVWLTAQRKERTQLASRFDREITLGVYSGPEAAGMRLDGPPRDYLRVTYLKPLRDAEQELAARRGSRLSRLFLAHPAMKDHADILSFVREANQKIEDHPTIAGYRTLINEDLSRLKLGADPVQGEIVLSDPEIRAVLEQLQLVLRDIQRETDDVDTGSLKVATPRNRVTTRHGLGMNNLLFIAAELLLLRGRQGQIPLVLIEEPEAHLHPQLQHRVVETLTGISGAQVIMTSHSPNLASKSSLDNLIVMQLGKAFPLAQGSTGLSPSDYLFLGRFLDATKASLFFARGVILVEGVSEQILVPALGSLLGLSLSAFGISVIAVGHVGLFRYAKVFRRSAQDDMRTPVACITDLDIPPDCATSYLRPGRRGRRCATWGQYTAAKREAVAASKNAAPGETMIQTFVSRLWTLEYEFAYGECAVDVLSAVLMAQWTRLKGRPPVPRDEERTVARAQSLVKSWSREGKREDEVAALIYRPLYEGRASKTETAQHLAHLLERRFSGASPETVRAALPQYIVDAIEWVTSASLARTAPSPSQTTGRAPAGQP